MHDNSRVLRAVLVNTFLQRARITRMERPACSPDMDKIEHVWELILDVDNDHILHATYAESPLKSGPGLAWSSYRWYATTDSRPHPSKGTFQHVFMWLRRTVKTPPMGNTILLLHFFFVTWIHCKNEYLRMPQSQLLFSVPWFPKERGDAKLLLTCVF